MENQRDKKRKSPPFWVYMNPKNLNQEIWRYGYHFSIRKTMGYLLLVYGGIAALSYLVKLDVPYIIIIMAVVTLFYPSIVAMMFRNLYEQKKFEDITTYMEQLLYSFKRRGKILIALEDTRTLFFTTNGKKQSELYQAINHAIDHIQTGLTEGNIYREAFSYIEAEYGCKRLYKIHDYLIQVETSGGKYSTAIETLLMDRQLWMDRIYSILAEKQKIKAKMTLGVALSMLIVYLAVWMMPKDFGITGQVFSQVASMLVIIIDFFIWYSVQQKLSGSLIGEEGNMPYEEMKRKYTYIMHGDIQKEKRKYRIISCVFIPIAILSYFKIGALPSVLLAGFSGILSTQPKRKYTTFWQSIRKETEKQFPEWLMGLTLQLQSNNVHVSISRSIDTAPAILTGELKKLEAGIEQEPNSIQPYNLFFKKLDIPDVTSAMRMLYSMATFGFDDNNKQIQGLVDRNTVMIDKAERMKAEDKLAGIGFLVLLPMVTGVLKMLVDLMLVIFYLLATVNTI